MFVKFGDPCVSEGQIRDVTCLVCSAASSSLDMPGSPREAHWRSTSRSGAQLSKTNKTADSLSKHWTRRWDIGTRFLPEQRTHRFRAPDPHPIRFSESFHQDHIIFKKQWCNPQPSERDTCYTNNQLSANICLDPHFLTNTAFHWCRWWLGSPPSQGGFWIHQQHVFQAHWGCKKGSDFRDETPFSNISPRGRSEQKMYKMHVVPRLVVQSGAVCCFYFSLLSV